MTSFFFGYAALLTVNLLCQGRNLLATALFIHGPNERTMVAGSNFLLSCHGNETLSWRYPSMGDAVFSVISKTTPDGYDSVLTVESSDYLSTGFYECFSNSEETQVYVFVFDENHLLAVNQEETLLVGHQYENIIIPCKPTSPDVNVTLSYPDRPVNFHSYDPKRGFTLSNITISDSDSLICTATKDGDEQSTDFFLSINPRSEIAPKPEIEEMDIHHVIVGQDLTLRCYVTVEIGLTFTMNWTLPEGANKKDHYMIGNTTRENNPGESSHLSTWMKPLFLSRVSKGDEGNYTCRIVDHSGNINSDTKYLRVFSKDDSFINITVQSNRIVVDADKDFSAKWIVTVNAHPHAILSWYGPDQKEITRSVELSKKFDVRSSSTQTTLEVRDVTLQDAGNYTFIASNSGGKEVVILELVVLGKPIVNVSTEPFYKTGVATNVSCFVNGYPPPFIKWKFRNCTQQERSKICSDFLTISPETSNIWELQIDESHIHSTLEWGMTEPGELSCIAENEKGTVKDVVSLRVTDVPEGFTISEAPAQTVEGDDLTLSCGVNSYEYLNSPIWYYAANGAEELVDSNLIIHRSKNHAYLTEIRMKNINVSCSGEYMCRAYKKSEYGDSTEKSIVLNVLKVESPSIYETNLPNSEMTISSWQPLTWKCMAKGVPEPSVLWYKDGELLYVDEFSNYELLDSNQTLAIRSLTIEEEGRYVCRVMNKGGEAEAFVSLTLKDSHKANTTLIITVVIVVILLIIVLFSFFYALWKISKEKKELRLAGLQNFKEGMTKSINQELTLDQQTDLLPYDPKWEFPSSKLKLGKQLGAGAFGVVLKAEAYGIVENEESTTVAVKMVKRHADPAYIRALVSELKILAHLGKHLNVVNLLGACTKNYMKRELLVIVEFCKYGNAHNYLLSHRHRFIDQIDAATGEIDVTKRNFVEAFNRISVDSDPNSALASFNTETTCLSSVRSITDDDNGVNNNPDWCPNLQGDYKKCNTDELSTSTLVCWGFQVARGMEYLASRRVLHGDLAARNVLIADNNIVKICDFGFAKNIYSHPEYQKTGDGPVPVKWMAIESITRRIFSTQSDVWSFGIVLWEFFSLAKTPYPGFENYESILKKLEDGYRMEKPLYANQRLYDIMLECWDQQPCRRPSFSELVMKLGKFLESNVREHYIELNEPFLRQTIPEGEDYLSMMSPPTYDSPTSHYVNEPFGKENQTSDGYLDMRSSWTPTTPKGTNPEDSIEMKPMLSDKERNDEMLEDYLIPRHVPANSDCAFNPSYVMRSDVQNKPPSNYGKINKV